MFNSIKKMLRIINDNLEITDSNQEAFKGVHPLVLSAKLSPSPSVCKNCRSLLVAENESITIVKNGTKVSTIHFEAFGHLPMIMN